jgi:hypothetical protein
MNDDFSKCHEMQSANPIRRLSKMRRWSTNFIVAYVSFFLLKFCRSDYVIICLKIISFSCGSPTVIQKFLALKNAAAFCFVSILKTTSYITSFYT